jgi:tetratricopeptide (TPR) repeat protein
MKKIYLFASILTMFLLVACKNVLDVQPRQSIDSQNALTNETAILAALRGCYDRLQNLDLYGSRMIVWAEALSDNGRGRSGTNGSSTNSGRLQGHLQNVPGNHVNCWTQHYTLINQVNLIIEAVPKVAEITEPNRNAILGQAYFLRALAYHDLVKSYAYDPGAEVPALDRGGVPIILEGVLDASQIKFPRRNLVSEVYDQIYKDLDEAVARLSNAGTISTPAFAGLAAANALYARVALYRRDYATAIQRANIALTSGAPAMVSAGSYFQAWRSPVHPEAILELPFQTPENIGVNESLQASFTSTVLKQSTSVTGGWGDLVMNDAYGVNLVADGATMPAGTTASPSAPAADVRFPAAVSGATDGIVRRGSPGRGNQALSELTKFYGKNGQVNLDNVPLIRTPELYLTLAEAHYHLGNTAQAQANLAFVIRNRYLGSGGAALISVSVTLTEEALLNEILRQRRLEFAFEGHRFFDLKRNGLNIARPLGTLPFTDFRILAPIPQSEIDANPNLVQNAGY